MFESAKAYCEKEHPDEVDRANSITPNTFKNLRSKQFLSEYCWVVYASGFKVAILETIFPDLKAAFKDFELGELAKMKSTKPVLAIFNNERKANSFLAGSKRIAQEGFSEFKKRLQNTCVDMLEELPGIWANHKISPCQKYRLSGLKQSLTFGLSGQQMLVHQRCKNLWLFSARNTECHATLLM